MYPTFELFSVTWYSYGLALSSTFIVLFLWVKSVCPKPLLTGNDFYILLLFALVSVATPLFLAFMLENASKNILQFGTYPLLITAIFLTLPYLYLRKKPPAKVFDFLVPYVLFAIACQRLLGCFMAGCCYGQPTDLPWGITFHPSSVAWAHFPTALHPTQLYYGVPLLLMSMILLKWRKHFFPGITTSLGGITIGVVYFVVHFLRGDVRPIGSHTLMLNQYFSLAFIVIGILLLFVIFWRGKPTAVPVSTTNDVDIRSTAD